MEKKFTLKSNARVDVFVCAFFNLDCSANLSDCGVIKPVTVPLYNLRNTWEHSQRKQAFLSTRLNTDVGFVRQQQYIYVPKYNQRERQGFSDRSPVKHDDP